MSEFRETLREPIGERTTATLEFDLTDENEVAIIDGDITTIVYSLYDKRSGTILNGQDETNVRNANGGTLSATGTFALVLSDDDNALLNPSARQETHIALIVWTWDAGTKSGWKELSFTVLGQVKIT